MRKNYITPQMVAISMKSSDDIMDVQFHDCSVKVVNTVSSQAQLSKSNNSFFDDSEEEED